MTSTIVGKALRPRPTFVAMLTQNDVTVPNPILALDAVENSRLEHVGLKEAGLSPQAFRELVKHLKALGKKVYLELMEETQSSVLAYANLAIETGVDVLLGTRRSLELDKLISSSSLRYFPVFDQANLYRATLAGDVEKAGDEINRLCDADFVTGVLLNPFRIQCSPRNLIRTAMGAGKPVFVTGSIDSLTKIELLMESGADAFAIGTGIFEKVFCKGDVRAQYEHILDFLDAGPHQCH